MTVALRPSALRSILVPTVAAAHVAAFAGCARLADEAPAPPGFREVGVVAHGEVAFEARAVPVPDRPEPAPPTETPPTPPQPASAPSNPSAPEAPEPLPARPDAEPELPTPTPPAEVRPETPSSPAVSTAAAAASGAPAVAAAQRLGVEEARSDRSDAAAHRYAALVSAEINRRKHFPADAQRRGSRGIVGLSFTVGRSGAVDSHAVTQSSGSDALDAAAVAMLHGARLPPPPGGFFRGTVLIRFQIRP